MKNRILRTTIAIALIVAMTFTFVACAGDTTTQTTAPTQAPVVDDVPTLVVTESPTVAPTISADKKEEVSANSFDISIDGYDGVYGTMLEDDDENEIAHGYFQIEWDTDLTTDSDYSLDFEVEIDGEDSYSFEFCIPATNLKTAPTYEKSGSTATMFGSSFEDGYYFSLSDIDSSVSSNSENNIRITVFEGYLTIAFANADEYELSADVTISDKAFDYGAWNEEDKTAYELSFDAEMTIEKQQVTIEISPAVICETEYELEVYAAGTYDYNSYSDYDVVSVTNYSGDEILSTRVFLPATYVFDGNSIGLEYELSYVKENAVGTYSVPIAQSYTYNGVVYDDLDDLNEKFDNYEIVAVADTAVYVISEYDYTELADVITSIAEITFDSTSTFANNNDFFGTSSNIEVQLPLALSRYNGLKTAQSLYLETSANLGFWNYNCLNVYYFLKYAATDGYDFEYINFDYDAYDYMSDDEKDTYISSFKYEANALLEYFQYAQDAYADHIIWSDFDEYAEDADLPEVDETFNINNNNHTASFKLVDSYFNSLSDDSQDVIESENTEWYQSYQNAKALLEAAEIDSVEQLIAGAYSAYLKAIINGTKVIYIDTEANDITTSWAYIQSDETISLTNQALAAYNALSETAQENLQDAGSDDQIYNLTNYVAFKEGEDTCYNALEMLVSMNEMVDVMVEITQYVNIEDYSASSPTMLIPYSRLNALVYGIDYYTYDSEGEVTSLTLGGLYFPTYTGNDGAQDYRFAMKDIINAPERNYDAIIAEYKEWLTYIIKIEEYKTTALMEFVSEIAFYAGKLDEDDYSDYVISGVADSSNTVATLIVAAIMYEDISAYMNSYDGTYTVVGAFEPSIFDSTAVILTNEDVIPFFYAGFLEDKDSFDDVYESYDDFMDLEDIVDTYMDAVLEK